MSDLWNVLHDGTIAAIDGSVPGDVRLTVHIPYLREMWQDGGSNLLIYLDGCQKFEWHIFGAGHQTIVWEDLISIAQARPAIRSAADVGDAIHIYIRGVENVPQSHGNPHPLWQLEGELRLQYARLRLKLDTGQELTLAEVREKATAYWDRQRD